VRSRRRVETKSRAERECEAVKSIAEGRPSSRGLCNRWLRGGRAQRRLRKELIVSTELEVVLRVQISSDP